MRQTFFILLIILIPHNSYAQDNSRQGFIIGFGVGLYNMDLDYKINGRNIGSNSERGLATSFKIGGGITDDFLLYFIRNASWYNSDSQLVAIGINGIGATYYLPPLHPSLYLLTTIGIGDFSIIGIDPSPKNSASTETGRAYMLGVGYEFSEHLLLEASYLATNLKIKTPEPDLNTSSLQFTVNYLFY